MALCVGCNYAEAQNAGGQNIADAGGYRMVEYVGLQIQTSPTFDIEAQLKHYWLFDTSQSNNGPGVGCELNFGTNSSGITIGPKLFYQGDVFMCMIGGKRKSQLYVMGRISAIEYINKEGNDLRIAPEGGLSLYERLSCMYGFNFHFFKGNDLKAVFNSRFTVLITIGGKKK